MLFQEHKLINKNFSEDDNPYTVTEISLIIKQYVENSFKGSVQQKNFCKKRSRLFFVLMVWSLTQKNK